MKIAIIGAGAAGLAALRRVLEASTEALPIEAVVYEKTGKIGGTWVYVPETGKDEYGLPVHSSMYDSLRTNLPKEVMGYPGYPIPENSEKRSYLTRTEILAFLESFAEHFKLREHIHLYHNVELVEPVGGTSEWKVRVRDLKGDRSLDVRFDAVMVCSGHYFEPAIPVIKGADKFKGETLHSHDYRRPEHFAGKRVVVVGAGPSGMDLALEISRKATSVILSHHSTEEILTQFPANVSQKPDIVEMTVNAVKFADETEAEVDAIFYCTGYKYSFPFLSRAAGVRVDDNMVAPLWKQVISIANPTMALIGLPFYVCAFSMFDLQARFVLKFWTNKAQLPERSVMLADHEKEKKDRFEVRGWSKRQFHMMGPLQGEYYDDLARTAGVEGLPPVLIKIHNVSSKRFLDDLVHYRGDRFEIIDSDNFTSTVAQ
ncbi:senecionine N-oxygenase-like [Copidosoma floridanum]|uniref:senecionine N-oxygenase-like n=1 Tax=Copidosoma floridanum TaxID=29053 RepID=UPI0006C99453|nr:senecionine N-oxygenase-like [Copidosoma floridanum]